MALQELLKQPEFYDVFGLAVFLFITIIAIWSLKKNKPLPKWVNVVLILIGLAGLIVDGYIVLTKFIF